MPANLTPQYFAAEVKYKEASTVRDKLKALRGMLAAIPKHKGTEKLQGDIKRRIALLGEEEERSRRKGGRGPSPDHVPREGAGQVVIVGGPNGGKSALFGALTGAEPGVAPYPFTTQRPRPGMVEWGGIQIQLVDSPAYSDEHMEPWVPNVARSGHALLLLVDLSVAFPEEQLARLAAFLDEAGIELVPEEAWDRAIEDPVFVKRGLLVGAKADLVSGPAARAAAGHTLHPVSVATGEGIDDLPRLLFRLLSILRVYAKMPRHDPDRERPFTLPIGATVGDLCRIIHKDFADNLRFARLWRGSGFQGVQVHQDHVLEDQDAVELHI